MLNVRWPLERVKEMLDVDISLSVQRAHDVCDTFDIHRCPVKQTIERMEKAKMTVSNSADINAYGKPLFCRRKFLTNT